MSIVPIYKIFDNKIIGTGSFAKVYLGSLDSTEKLVAIKRIDKKTINTRIQKCITSELSIIKNLEHENIVKTFAIEETDNYIDIIMEYCNGGSLDALFSSTGDNKYSTLSGDSENMVQYFMKQLKSGLKYLYDKNIVHRDLKPANLLLISLPAYLDKHRKLISKQEIPEEIIVNADHQKNDKISRKILLKDYLIENYHEFGLKLCDFGLARELEADTLTATMCGSPYYMAPEIISGHRYNNKTDLWSVGIIMYQLLFDKSPYNDAKNLNDLVYNLRRHPVRYPFEDNEKDYRLSSSCKSMLFGLLHRDSEKRICYMTFFNHPWFADCPESAKQLTPLIAKNNDVKVNLTQSHTSLIPCDVVLVPKQPETDVNKKQQKEQLKVEVIPDKDIKKDVILEAQKESSKPENNQQKGYISRTLGKLLFLS